MPLKILLADDSMIAQNMGKKILTEAGYNVTTVSNGAAAIKKFSELQPDIVLLDVYMPGYSGLEVTEKIRSSPATCDLPILLTVGKLEPFRPEEGIKAKADGVIVKPFEATDLIAVVDQLAQRVSAKLAAPPSGPEPEPSPGPEAGAATENEHQPWSAPAGSPEPVAPIPVPQGLGGGSSDEDLLQALAFGMIEPVRGSEPETPPPPAAAAPLLPAEVQVAVAALDFTSEELDLPSFVIAPQPVSGTPPPQPPPAPRVTTEFRPLEIRMEPMLEPTAEPRPDADNWHAPALAEPEPLAAQSSAPPTEALPRPAPPPLTAEAPSAPMPSPGHHQPEVARGGAPPGVASENALADELPEFALFSSVFGSPRDGQFEARLADTMEAFDAAATVPEPRPAPAPLRGAKITEPAPPPWPTPEKTSATPGGSFEIDLQELLGEEPVSEPKSPMADAAAVPAASADSFIPPAQPQPVVPPPVRRSELDTSFDDDIGRVLHAALADPATQLGTAGGERPSPAPAFHEEAAQPAVEVEIANLVAPEAPLGAEPITMVPPAPAEAVTVEAPAEAEPIAPPAEEPEVSVADESPFVPAAAQSLAQPPEPAVAAVSEPVAEQIVDRVLRRLRPELVEEVRRLLQNPEV